ncbi:MAG TPA: sulfotransferase family 2 domain-containing protein [Terriglobales bacterium]|nr:sulfotransferase family 2 domain-containing protein [Terriglobales bacterium]
MLLSDTSKVLFVHIQKTGGETVASILKKNVPDTRALGAKHEFARSGELRLGDAWNNYFKFAFVRNPWDRLVSWYSMITRARQITRLQAWLNSRKRRHLRQTVSNPMWRYVYENCATFEGFIKTCTAEIESAEGARYSFAYNQLDYLVDEDGKLLIDFVGRFENFSEDLHACAKKAGLRLRQIPRANVSSHRHYSRYYTPELEEIVKERFARDIKSFGYNFERQ